MFTCCLLCSSWCATELILAVHFSLGCVWSLIQQTNTETRCVMFMFYVLLMLVLYSDTQRTHAAADSRLREDKRFIKKGLENYNIMKQELLTLEVHSPLKQTQRKSKYKRPSLIRGQSLNIPLNQPCSQSNLAMQMGHFLYCCVYLTYPTNQIKQIKEIQNQNTEKPPPKNWQIWLG